LISKKKKKLEENTPSVDIFLEDMERTKIEVKIALKKTNEVMEQKFNVRKKTEIDFQEGDLVWVDGSHYNDGYPLKKFSLLLESFFVLNLVSRSCLTSLLVVRR